MNNLHLTSFKEYLAASITEDAQTEVTKLQGDLAAIDVQLLQKTKPLQDRKNQLQKLLSTKQQQAQQEKARISNTQVPPTTPQPPSSVPGTPSA